MQTARKLNWLEQHLPEGLLADATWLTKHGYSTGLRSQYGSRGRLEQPVRECTEGRVESSPGSRPSSRSRPCLNIRSWQGGEPRSNCRLRPLFAPDDKGGSSVRPQAAPSLAFQAGDQCALCLAQRPEALSQRIDNAHLTSPGWNLENDEVRSNDPIHANFTMLPWGQWEWPLTLSTPERAILELLDELPARESFHQVDKLMEGLTPCCRRPSARAWRSKRA